MDCNCPSTGILTEIPQDNCPFDLKQIQRLAFATKGKVIFDSATGGGAGDGAPQVNSQVDTLADWNARKTATDNTKIVLTPTIGGDPIIEAGEATVEGGTGGNDTLDGQEKVTGVGASKFSAFFRSLSPAQEKSLKKLRCADAEVYFILQGGRIACVNVEGTKKCKGFNVGSLFISDRNNAGNNTDDKHNISLSLSSGWSEDLIIVTPKDFDAVYDI